MQGMPSGACVCVCVCGSQEKGDEEETIFSELQRSEESEKGSTACQYCLCILSTPPIFSPTVTFSLSGQQTSTSASASVEESKEEASHEQTEAMPPLPSTASGFVRKKNSSLG